jgi:nucleotide-binding universal stress UspA family protein
VGIAKLVEGKDSSEVILFHVIAEYPISPYIERPVRSPRTGQTTTLSRYIREVYELMAASAMDLLEKKKEEVKRSDDFEILVKVSTGHVSDEIIEFAKQEGIDLIVIGNVGQTGISKLKTLGSVSRAVSERAPCPIMIVH